MLGRKVPGSAGGMDRGRTGERLQAALAGLQELRFLRDKQKAMVHWALTLHREADASKGDNISAEELRLETTLTLLKQQLTRLRKQDVGLKTHLQQLDQQINDLKLDVCKASTEHLESDSRPSSGFFELSDVGSGSLSNSCTSVYSESLSSSSQINLLPLHSTLCPPHIRTASGQSGVSRRSSADESTAQCDAPRSMGVKLGMRTTPARADRARQRPVSTGDLDRMISPGGIFSKFHDGNGSMASSSLINPPVDPKFLSNLVSSNGAEVYRYPSPLHAVALQSPIFSCTGDLGSHVAAEATEVKLGFEDKNQNQASANASTAGCISRILQRSSSRMSLSSEARKSQSSSDPSQPIQPTMSLECAPENGKKPSALIPSQQERYASGNQSSLEEVEDHDTHSVNGQQNFCLLHEQGTHFDNGLSRKSHRNFTEMSSKQVSRRPSFRNEDSRSSCSEKGGLIQPDFVHAQFVPAGSQKVKVRQADRKNKPVKAKKKSSEKAPAKKPPQKHLVRESCSKTMMEGKISASKVNRTNLEESRPCLDCTRNGPAHLQPSQKTIKIRQSSYTDVSQDQAKKKSCRKWPSASEVQLPPTVYTQRPRESSSSRKTSLVRSYSARPRSGQWGGQQRHLPHSLSTSSYFSYLESRYPPAPASRRQPPRCQSEFSEYSAECASLFHSTIAASSDGEMSDYTANRFGDSESSQGSQTASDSDSSLSLDEEDLLEEEEEEEESGLVWAQATMGTTAGGFSLQQQQQQHRSESAACRIKASRALKKKIRRFQPASLKVMTLV